MRTVALALVVYGNKYERIIAIEQCIQVKRDTPEEEEKKKDAERKLEAI